MTAAGDSCFWLADFSNSSPPKATGNSCFWLSGFFRNQPIRNKNCLWQPCLLTDRNKMSKLYRGPSIDASYQVSVHLAKRFQRRCHRQFLFLIGWFLKNFSSVKRKITLDIISLSNLHRGHSIDVSYQVSVHLAKRFQRRRFLKISQSETRIACGSHVW
jgi:hypothetical protein